MKIQQQQILNYGLITFINHHHQFVRVLRAVMPKAEKKKQQKVIADRTFGLKNKNKSKTVQNYIKGVENTVKNSGKSQSMLQAEEFENKKMKKKQLQEQALLQALFKDVGKLQQQSEEDQDPKNIVCPYFKQGLCQKGKKCIYSHDLAQDRNQQIDLYVDQRTQLIMNQIGTKNLNDISEEDLQKMISDKSKQYIKGAKSEIICKYFMQAVEKEKYGWNWTCQNGGDSCKYKHCLPPGYILQKDAAKVKVETQVNIEQKIDEQRNNLLNQNKQSPLVSFDVFMKWKEERAIRKIKQAQKKKKDEQKKNKNKAMLRNGRQLFTYDPALFIDDAEAADDYEQREQQIEQQQQGMQKREQMYEGEDGEDGEDGENCGQQETMQAQAEEKVEQEKQQKN